MNKSIKIINSRSEEPEDLGNSTTRLILPNGTEFTFKYNHHYGGLEIVKAFADEDGAIQIRPQVSNHIILI